MIAYNYDSVTREYIGRETAQENPKHPGEYLIPAHSTLTEPPAIREGYARIWNGEEWDYAEDHRGETVWKNHSTSRTIDTLGPRPEGWTVERPAKNISRSDITEKIYQAKSKIAYGGLTVNRSGINYTFATDTDSISLGNAVLLSAPASINWKVWQGDTPATLNLTAAELRSVFAAGMAMVQQAFSTEAELNEEYAALTDAQIAALTEAEIDNNISARFAMIHPVMEI